MKNKKFFVGFVSLALMLPACASSNNQNSSNNKINIYTRRFYFLLKIYPFPAFPEVFC